MSQFSTETLRALNEAALNIARNVSLDKVLTQITKSAQTLGNAQYAALGVPNKDGFLTEFIFTGMDAETAARMPHRPKGLGLLGSLHQVDHPVRVPVIHESPLSSGFPDNHPPMTSFIGVPVTTGEKVLGNLYLTNKLDEDGKIIQFTKDDEHILQLLAAHAAIAIQNAHLYQEVSRLAIVDERSRIGMDLHDGVIQSIYAVGLALESIKMLLDSDPETTNLLIDNAIDGLNGAIKDIRNFIFDLRPRRFEGRLSQGLSQLVREFQANTMIPVSLELNEQLDQQISGAIGRTFFLATQEALANIARHADASQISISLIRENSNVSLAIQDNGKGFDVVTKKSSVGHGLSNMRTRADELNGRFSIDSLKGSGTTINLTLPLNPTDE